MRQLTPRRVQQPAERRVPLATALLYSVGHLGAGLVYSLFFYGMPKYLDSYHLRPELIGLLSSERSFMTSIVQPFVGRLSDRTRTRLGRRRPFMLAGVPLMALALVVLGLHPSLVVVVIFIALACLFLNVAQDPYGALLADISPAEQRGRIGAFLGFASLLGTVVFNLVAAALWTKHQFAVFAFVAAGAVIAYGVTVCTVREPAHPAPAQRIPTTPLRYLRDLLRHRELTRYVVAMWLFYVGLGGANPFAVLFGTKTLHLPDSQAFLLIIVIAVSTAIGTVPAGLLGDRLGKKPVLVAGLALIVAGALVGAQVHSLGWAIPALVLFGLGVAAPTALNLPLLTELVPAGRMAELLGVCSALWATAPSVGAVCAGYLIDAAVPDTYRHAFVWAAVLTAAAAVMLTLRPRRARAELAVDVEEAVALG